MTEFPIVDEHGEVLATDESERQEVMQEIAGCIIVCTNAADQLPAFRRQMELLMSVGDSVAMDGYAISCELGPRPARQVNKQEVLVHAESLTPLGLAPREETTVKVVYPGVAQLLKAKADLARAGLNVNALLLEGGEPRPEIRVYAPKDEA